MRSLLFKGYAMIPLGVWLGRLDFLLIRFLRYMGYIYMVYKI